MSAVLRFWRSTVGKKVVMAVTGIIGIAFVIVHMLGNLQAFAGAEKLNGYAALLHGPLAEIVWLQRVVLIGAVILHVVAAAQLTALQRAARPIGYQRRAHQAATFGSRTIRVGGVLLLAFIILHILHFTTRTINPAGISEATPIYTDVVASFRIWWVTLLYVVAMLALLAHLFHGAWSSFRSLGVAKPGENPLKRSVAATVALVVAVGFLAVPLGVFFGIIR